MTNTTHATPEPVCCGERMVRYPGVSWECAAAYFGLKDDGVIDDLGFSPPVLYDDRATPEQRELDSHPAGPGCCQSPWAERSYQEHGGRLRHDVEHLLLADPHPFPEPIPMRGRLGLWNVPDYPYVHDEPEGAPHPSYTEEAPRG